MRQVKNKNSDTAAARVKAREAEMKKNIASPWTLARKRLLRNKLAVFGMIFLAVMVVLCIVGPMVSPYSNLAADVHLYQAKMPPSGAHWLGTDESGRDVLTRLMFGGRISMTVGLVATAIEIFLGTFLGCMSAFYGGKVDFIMMRVVDIFLCLPSLPILIILSAMMTDWKVDSNVRIYYLMLILAALGWAGICRFVRGQVLTIREMDYMSAAECLGIRDIKKIFKHIIPNVVPLIIVTATLGVGDTILMESALSWLGLGVQPPWSSWGQMVAAGNDLMTFRLRPWMWVPAGLCILCTVLAVNLVGDGMRDALDPKMKR